MERSRAWTRPQPPSWFRAVSSFGFANGGHGYQAWEFRRPLALLLGHCARRRCPQRGLFLVSGLFPALPHLLGRGTGQRTLLTPLGRHLLFHARSTYFSATFASSLLSGNAPMRTQHPFLMAVPLSPRGCGLALPFVLPFHTSHPFPHFTLL